MSDLKLKRITLRNWMWMENVEVDFPEKGLVLVTGVNKASGGKLASVGAGKTALGEAICRSVFGSRGRFTRPESYSTGKKGNCYVKAELDHRGTPFVIENGYKCKEISTTGEGLRYSYDGKSPVERSRLAETRDEIASIIGVTPSLSNWTVFIRGNRIEFDQLSQEESVNLVMAALMQPPWTQFYERSKTVVNSFKSSVANDKSNHASALRNLEDAREDVKDAEALLADETKAYSEQRQKNDERIQQLRQEIKSKQQVSKEAGNRKKSIRKRIAEIEAEKAEKQHALEIERNSIDDEIAAAQERRDSIIEDRAKLSSALDSAEDRLKELKGTPKDCPTCGKPWDNAHGAEEVSKQESAVAKAKKAYDKVDATYSKAVEALQTLHKKRRDVALKLTQLNVEREVKSLRDDYAAIESNDRLLDSRIHAIELEIVNLKKDVSDAKVQSARAKLEERRSRVAAVEDDIKTYAASLAESEEALKVVSYWNKAFGPTGIPNMVLSEAVGPLNHVSRAISNRMTGGTIQVSYSTTKQLVSGASRAELIVNVNNEIGSSEVQGSSNGEAGLTNFIIAETLAEVGNVSSRVGFRWYDEVVPYQDPVVAKSIYSYMKETADRLGILIFLVDHNPVAANYADHVLVVEKTRTGTNITWK